MADDQVEDILQREVTPPSHVLPVDCLLESFILQQLPTRNNNNNNNSIKQRGDDPTSPSIHIPINFICYFYLFINLYSNQPTNQMGLVCLRAAVTSVFIHPTSISDPLPAGWQLCPKIAKIIETIRSWVNKKCYPIEDRKWVYLIM